MIPSWLIDQLIQQGVGHFCIAPGSRSTPLVLACLNRKISETYVHYDERGLGFLALGINQRSSKIAAVIVTSGSAVANLLPAVMEAHHSCTPLLILTADRPPELRDCGANQTTDQIKIFQPFVRWQVDLPVQAEEKTIRSIAAQAHFYMVQNPPGPVHINCPFSEPFLDFPVCQAKPIPLSLPTLIAQQKKVEAKKGLIVVGKLPKADDIFPILELAKKLKWPLVADILSNARLFRTENQVLASPLLPDLILHFGTQLTNLKPIHAKTIHISPYPQLQDPERLFVERVQSDIAPFCERFEASAADPSWLSQWTPIPKATDVIPEEFAIFLGNSMTIREADRSLFPKKCRGFFANRGVSGIDGNIATIAGLANVSPVFAIIGDQTALYDLNSLPLIKKAKHKVVLVIANNFGGGIFHKFAIAKSPHFHTHWRLEHPYSFEKAAELFHIPYCQNLAEGLKMDETILIEQCLPSSSSMAFWEIQEIGTP